MWHELKTDITLPAPRDEVFAFFSDAFNLERITPDSVRFRILTPAPIKMEVGTFIDYQLRINGIPARWRTRIPVWNPPTEFVDEQVRGPYRNWIHRHTFETVGEGTRIVDHVRFRLPLSPLGEIALPWIKPQLRHIFLHRNRTIADIFGIPEPALEVEINAAS